MNQTNEHNASSEAAVPGGTLQNPRHSVFLADTRQVVNTTLRRAEEIRYAADIELAGRSRDNYFALERLDASVPDMTRSALGQASKAVFGTGANMAMTLYRAGAAGIMAAKLAWDKSGETRQLADKLRMGQIEGEAAKRENEEIQARYEKIKAFGREALQVMKRNHERFLQEAGLAKDEQDGFVYDLISGGTTLAAAVAVTAITKSPAAASALFGAYAGRSDYEEALENGISPDKAMLVGFAGGLAEGGLEHLGLGALEKIFKGKGILRAGLKGFTTEAVQEGTQQTAEEIIMQHFGGREKEMEETWQDIAYSALLGGLTGFGVSTVMNFAVKQFEAKGADPQTAQKLAETAVRYAASDEMQEAAHKTLSNVTSALNYPQADVAQGAKEFGDAYRGARERNVRRMVYNVAERTQEAAKNAGYDEDTAELLGELEQSRANSIYGLAGVTPGAQMDLTEVRFERIENAQETQPQETPQEYDVEAYGLPDGGPLFQAAAMYKNPAKSLAEFRTFAVQNQGNPKEDNKSFYRFTTKDGLDVEVPFERALHIDGNHNLTDDQLAIVENYLTDPVYAAILPYVGEYQGRQVKIKLNTPLGSMGAVLEVLPKGRVFLNTAFFDTDANIDNWAKGNPPNAPSDKPVFIGEGHKYSLADIVQKIKGTEFNQDERGSVTEIHDVNGTVYDKNGKLVTLRENPNLKPITRKEYAALNIAHNNTAQSKKAVLAEMFGKQNHLTLNNGGEKFILSRNSAKKMLHTQISAQKDRLNALKADGTARREAYALVKEITALAPKIFPNAQLVYEHADLKGVPGRTIKRYGAAFSYKGKNYLAMFVIKQDKLADMQIYDYQAEEEKKTGFRYSAASGSQYAPSIVSIDELKTFVNSKLDKYRNKKTVWEAALPLRDKTRTTGEIGLQNNPIGPNGTISIAPKEEFFKGRTLNQGPRGSVTFDENANVAVIRAFAAADKSTALHEFAHVWRRDLMRFEDVSSEPDYLQLMQDMHNMDADAYDFVINFIKRTKLLNDFQRSIALHNLSKRGGKEYVRRLAFDKTLDANDVTAQFIRRAFEEHFAESFEAYVMRGKAPSARYESLFAKFGRWLRELYDAVLGQVEISPAVQSIFDRMMTRDAARVDSRLFTGKVEQIKRLVHNIRTGKPNAEGAPDLPQLKDLLSQLDAPRPQRPQTHLLKDLRKYGAEYANAGQIDKEAYKNARVYDKKGGVDDRPDVWLQKLGYMDFEDTTPETLQEAYDKIQRALDGEIIYTLGGEEQQAEWENYKANLDTLREVFGGDAREIRATLKAITALEAKGYRVVEKKDLAHMSLRLDELNRLAERLETKTKTAGEKDALDKKTLDAARKIKRNILAELEKRQVQGKSEMTALLKHAKTFEEIHSAAEGVLEFLRGAYEQTDAGRAEARRLDVPQTNWDGVRLELLKNYNEIVGQADDALKNAWNVLDEISALAAAGRILTEERARAKEQAERTVKELGEKLDGEYVRAMEKVLQSIPHLSAQDVRNFLASYGKKATRYRALNQSQVEHFIRTAQKTQEANYKKYMRGKIGNVLSRKMFEKAGSVRRAKYTPEALEFLKSAAETWHGTQEAAQKAYANAAETLDVNNPPSIWKALENRVLWIKADPGGEVSMADLRALYDDALAAVRGDRAFKRLEGVRKAVREDNLRLAAELALKDRKLPAGTAAYLLHGGTDLQTFLSICFGKYEVDEFDENAPSQTALPNEANTREEAIAHINSFIGQEIINKDKNFSAQINRVQRDKLVSEAAVHKSVSNGFTREEHFKTVANIKTLFENAFWNRTRTDRNNDPNIRAIHEFYAPITEEAVAFILVKESVQNGARIYTLELKEIKKPQSIVGTSGKTSIPASVDTDSITKNGDIFKTEPKGKLQNMLPAEAKTVAEINTKEYGFSGTLKEIKEKLVQWYKKNLQGTFATNPELGEVAFTRAGISEVKGKALSEKRAYLLTAAKNVIEQGSVIGEHAEQNNPQGIKKFYFVQGKVKLDGLPVIMQVDVAEDGRGKKFYYVSEIKTNNAGRVTHDQNTGSSNVDTDSITKNGDIFKPQTKKRVIDFREELAPLLAAAKENKHAWCTVGEVTNELVFAAKKYGLELAGFSHGLDSSAVNHIKNRHGNPQQEELRGQIAVTQEDYAALPDIVYAPDFVAFGAKNKKGLDLIIYGKNMPDGSSVCVEEVRTGKHTLALNSLRKYKTGIDSNSFAKRIGDVHSTNSGSISIVNKADIFKPQTKKRVIDFREELAPETNQIEEANFKARAQRDILRAVGEAYGLKSPLQIVDKIAEMQKDAVELTNYAYVKDQENGEIVATLFKNGQPLTHNKPRKQTVSRLDALTFWIWNQDHDFVQTAAGTEDYGLAGRLEYAYGRTQLENLFARLTPQDIEAAKNLQKLAEKHHAEESLVHQRIYGFPLPKKEFYFPSVTDRTADEIDLKQEFVQNSKAPSFIKQRVQNKRVIQRVSNPVDILRRHLRRAGEFIYNAEKYAELQRIFKQSSMGTAFEEAFGEKNGKKVYAKLLALINQQAPQTSPAKDEFYNAANKLFNGWVKAVMGFKPITGIKQFASSVSFAEQMPWSDWAKWFAEGLSKPLETAAFMKRMSPYIQTRYESGGMNEAVARAMAQDEISPVATRWNNLTNLMLLNTRLGDKASLIYGGYPYMKYLLDVKKLTPQAAARAFEKQATRTLQSSLRVHLSEGQAAADSFTARVFLVFKNQQLQYVRKVAESYAAYKNGEISAAQFAKTAFLYLVLNPMVYTMLGLGWFAADEDDWGEDLKRLLTSPVSQFFGAYPFGEGVADFFIDNAISVWKDQKLTPPQKAGLPMFDDIYKDAARAVKTVNIEDVTVTDFIPVFLDAAKYTGLPTQTFENMAGGAADVLGGKPLRGGLRLIGYTKNRAGKITGDDK